MLPVLNKALREQCLVILPYPVFTTRSSDNTEVYIGSCLEREMADCWYGEWTDLKEQQAPKEPPKKRLHLYAFLLFRIVSQFIMAPLKCCTFNCRGWKNCKLSLQNCINSLDFCFIQEHWLFDDHLNDVREICSDFLSVGVSGMSSDTLRCGRPYGGCSILY